MAARRFFDGAQVEIGSLPIEGGPVILVHTVDAVLKGTFTRTHTTDAYLVFTRSHTTDAFLTGSVLQTHTHATDAVLKATFTRTHTTDAVLKGSFTRTHTTDAVLRETFTRTHTTDVRLVRVFILQPWIELGIGTTIPAKIDPAAVGGAPVASPSPGPENKPTVATKRYRYIRRN